MLKERLDNRWVNVLQDNILFLVNLMKIFNLHYCFEESQSHLCEDELGQIGVCAGQKYIQSTYFQ